MKKIFLLLALISAKINVAQSKYGYIDYDKAVQSLPDYSLFQKNIDALKQHLEDSVNIMQNELANLYVPHSTKKYSEDSINKINARIEKFQTWAIDKYNQQQQSNQADLRTQLITKLQYYCTENNIDYISEKQIVFYCRNRIDFTEDVIKYIKQ